MLHIIYQKNGILVFKEHWSKDFFSKQKFIFYIRKLFFSYLKAFSISFLENLPCLNTKQVDDNRPSSTPETDQETEMMEKEPLPEKSKKNEVRFFDFLSTLYRKILLMDAL